jgi:hypothetical protein
MNIRTVNIKGKQYVDVAERVRLAHETRESFEIVSSSALQVGPLWVWQAVVLVDGKQYVGTAEIKFDAPKNTADGTNPVACAETSAVGRALGMAGLGCLESIASADEVVQAIAEQQHVQSRPAYDNDAPATKQQLDTIAKLHKQLGQEAADYSALNFGECASLLKELQQRLQTKRKDSSHA